MSLKRCTRQLLKSLSNAIKDSGSQLFCQKYQKRELVFRHRQFSTARASLRSVSTVQLYKLTLCIKLAGASHSKREVRLVQPEAVEVEESNARQLMSVLCNTHCRSIVNHDVALSSSMLAH
jgi:hypothetical protein